MAIGIILIVLAVFALGLGLRFLFGYQRSATPIYYGLFCLAVALYVAANGMGFTGWVVTPALAERLSWTGGALATAFFLPFALTFPYSQHTSRELIPLMVWPLFVFGPGFVWTEYFVQSDAAVVFGSGYKTDTGPLFWFFILFFAAYWLIAMTTLWRRFLHSDGIHRWQLKVLLAGLLVSLAGASVFDIAMPLVVGSTLGYVGSLLTSAWLGATSIVLLKK